MKTITKLIIFGAALWLCSACSRLDSDSRLFFRSSMSKGSAITTTNLNVAANTLIANAYLEGDIASYPGVTCARYIQDAEFTYNGSSSRWEASDCMWRNEVVTNFWCYYPKELTHGERVLTLPADNADDAAQKTMSFTYTMPEPASDSLDAQKTEDMVFAYARKEYNQSSGNEVKIEFQHAISAIQFTAGTIQSGYDIKYIAIKGFYTKGTCTLTGNCPSPMNSSDSISFAWSDLSVKSAGHIQKVTLAQLNNNEMVTGDKVFMVIPQVLTDDVQVTVTLKKGSLEVEKTASLGASKNVVWRPGKKYKYKLKYDDSSQTLSADLVDFNGTDWDSHTTDSTNPGTFTSGNWN